MTCKNAPNQLPAPRWLNETETAARLNMSVKWLQNDRHNGSRIPYAKFGSAVRYALEDIEAFEHRSMRRSTSDPGNGLGFGASDNGHD
jgi:hypothetical protein